MRVRSLLPLALATIFLAGCLSAPERAEEEIRIVGSDTMLELDRRFAEAYMRAHPGTSVRVEGGGSGVGIEALISGRAAIAATSRPLSSAEVAAIHEHFGTLGVRFLVAQDALSVWVNAANPVRDLGLEQLRGIFDGSLTEWSAVGGEASKISVIVRPPNSGTHRFFRDHVLSGTQYAPHAKTQPTTTAVLAGVAEDRTAIGYGGHAYRLEGAVQVGIDGVAPTAEEVGRGRYPLTRYLSFYTTEPPTGLALSLIHISEPTRPTT